MLFRLVWLLPLLFIYDTHGKNEDDGSLSALVNTTYAQRVEEHNLMVANTIPTWNRGTHGQTVLAALDMIPLDEKPLQVLFGIVGTNNTNSDFAIVILVRILFLTAKTTAADYYDDMVLPVLQSEQYWYTTEEGVVNDDTMNTENHMILWMSSAWLLQEREGWDMKDATLRQRLVHYLNLKIQYGFYEFLSITYLPFTFGALLNLVDFCQDSEIRGLAETAVRKLVSDYLLFVNDKGIHFTAAGRDYSKRFVDEPYTQFLDGILYVLTGLGKLDRRGIGFSCFLTTSGIDFSAEVSQWQASVDTTYTYGHTLEDSFDINAKLNKYDRTVFQMSQGISYLYESAVCSLDLFSFGMNAHIYTLAYIGAYAHPATIADTVDFLNHYGPLSLGSNFSLGGDSLPRSDETVPMSKLFTRLTFGTVWSGNSIQVYRQRGSMLTSVSNFWPGLVGGQTFPWMAVADDTPIWTQSGIVTEKWLSRNDRILNSHLPSVVQKDNMALIVYKPQQPMALNVLGHVTLHWPESRFDETRTVSSSVVKTSTGIFGSILESVLSLLSKPNDKSGSWILGRKGASYAAVYRPCGDAKDKGWFSCHGTFGRQVWAVVVGDIKRYGSFDAFASTIERSTVEETYHRRFLRKPLYVTSLSKESVRLQHDW